MSALEKLKTLCSARNVSFTRLENDLGFSHGSLLRVKKIPDIRLKLIAEYFGVPVSYFFDDEEGYYADTETAEYAQALMDNPELKVLFDAAKDVPKDVLQGVIAILEASKR